MIWQCATKMSILEYGSHQNYDSGKNIEKELLVMKT